MDTKSILTSKTFWYGVFQILGGFCLEISGEITAGAPLTLMGIVTIFLRVITSTKISL